MPPTASPRASMSPTMYTFESELIKLLSNESFDVVQLEGTFVGPYIASIRKVFKGLVSLRMHNVEFEIWQRLAQNDTRIASGPRYVPRK